MGDSSSSKPGSRPGGVAQPARPAAAGDNDKLAGETAGRIVHDDRGNAVWDWLKDTTRSAIDSTSRLLRRLEVPELKVEDTLDQELRVESDRDAGGGYDPYGGGSTPSRSPGGARSGTGGNSSGTRGGTTNNVGGGYDPYGKSITPRKPTRKP